MRWFYSALFSLVLTGPTVAQDRQDTPGVSAVPAQFTIDTDRRCRPDQICGGTPTPPVTGCLFTPRFCNVPLAPQEAGLWRVSQHTGAEDTSHPETVALLSGSNEVLCSGVLVSDTHVLTAAHCVCDFTPRFVFVGSDVDDLRTNPDGRIAASFTIDPRSLGTPPYVFEPTYCTLDKEERAAHPDIALLRFENDRPLADRFKRRVPFQVAPLDTPVARIVGFGASEKTASGGTKRFATVQTETCRRDDETGCNAELEFVAHDPDARDAASGRVDTCNGDSGGPVYWAGADFWIGMTLRSVEQEGPYCGAGGIYLEFGRIAHRENTESDHIQYWYRRVLEEY